MKKGLIVSFLMIVVIGYIYFFEFSASRKERIEEIKRSQLAATEGLEKIKVQVEGQAPITFVAGKGWWINDPVKYPADAGIIEQNLTVMRQVLADFQFPLEEDKYGFSNSKTNLHLFYKSGEEKFFILGMKKAPGNSLYLLEQKTKTVFVVNNVWGQFFYKSLNDFMVKDIYVNPRAIEKAWFKDIQSKGWEVAKTGERSWSYKGEQKEVEIAREPVGGLMRSLGKVKIKEVLFDQKEIDVFYTLSLWFKGGEKLELGLDKEKAMISLPHLKVIAKVDPSSVRYFLNEIKGAVKSGDKDSVTNKN